MDAVLYIAQSLDGRIADARGSVDWLHGFEDALGGFAEFLGTVDHVVMGARTYRQIAAFGEWPYGARPVTVIAREPVERHSAEVELLRAENVAEWAARCPARRP